MPQKAKVVAGDSKSFLDGVQGAVKCNVHQVKSEFVDDLYSIAEFDGTEAVCLLTENCFNN
jgi:hypothetical protein